MLKSPLWLRVAAPCLALGLGGGYVWMKQRAAPEPAVSTPESAVPAEREETMILPGSKSGPVGFGELERAEADTAAAKRAFEATGTPAPEPPKLLPSSKIGIIELQEEKPSPEGRPTVLPGSKSLVLEPGALEEMKKLLEEQKQKEAAPKQKEP